MATVEERVDTLEAILGQFIVHTDVALRRLETEMRAFQQEMQQFRETVNIEMQQFREEAERERREMNKKWGDLANKMGTLVEDIVAPNLHGVAQRYFGCVELDTFAARVYRTQVKDRSKRREFDIVATFGAIVLVNETKSNPRTEYINEFVQVLREIYDYFPEYQGKKIIPLFSSLYLPEDIVNYLTSQRIYVMGMKEDMMDLLNFDRLR
jgi:hypothetical protein